MQKVIVFTILLFLSWSHTGQPADSGQRLQTDGQGQIYTAQVEDTLDHLADKYYHDRSAWPAIWLATNAIAQEEDRFETLPDRHLIRPGQLLRIPPQAELAGWLGQYAAAGHPLTTAPQLEPMGSHWLADFAGYVEDNRQHFRIPGAALALVRGNQIALARGFGVRELGREAAVTPETVFAIGSTTKSMNSMLMATLVDAGVVDWDQPVVEIWPDFKLSDPTISPSLRVRDLLNMSSGLPRADLVWSGAGLTAEQVIESLSTMPLTASPRQRFQYNNQAVATGGYLGALAAGGSYGRLDQAYADLLQARIIEPIGMSSTSLSVEAAQANPNHATPHDFTLFAEVLPTHYHADTGIDPAGAVNANVLDLARFLMTQLNRGVSPNGTRIVSEQNLVETWQPQIEAYPGTSYALGWFVESYQDVEMIWHDGDVLGFKSLFVFIPEANVGLVLLTNRTISYGFSSSVRYHLIEALYGLDVSAGDQFRAQWDAFIEALPGIRAPLTAVVSPDEVAPYLGAYAAGWRVEQRTDGTLWASRGPYEWQLLAAGSGEFIVNNGFGITTPLQFTMAETGLVTMQFRLSTGEVGEYPQLEQ